MEKKLPIELAQTTVTFARPQPVRVMFQDEARFGRISDVRHCWQKKPFRPVVKAMVTQQYTYAYGAVSPVDGRFDALILPFVNGPCMQLFINEIGERYACENIVMIVDGAGWHKTHFELPGNVRLLFLPPYSPELNPQEHLWDELREKFFHNRVFESMDALEQQLELGLSELESQPERVKNIAGWDWIINSVSN